uniref:zincin-like metallopeptidase domain-containing protein n=1 Tax=Capnocytophaga leadbetteri TaxID=327575 RepID=UPI0028EED812
MEEFINLHNRTVSRSEVERVISIAKEQNNTEVIYRLSRILNAYPTEKRFVINIKDYPTPPTALAGAHHTGDYREALDENGRLRKGYKFVSGKIIPPQPSQLSAPSHPSQDDELTFLAAAGIDYFEQAPDDEAQGLGKPVPAADIYNMITDKIIKMLKSTKASDYKKTWEDDAFFIPLNFDSKKPYRGVNRMLLQERIGLTEAFANPYFLTFKQIKKHKGTLKKGAKGYEVVYYSIRYVVPADKNSGRKAYSSTNAHKVIDFLDKHKLPENIVTRIPMIRYYNVYNGEDITGIDFKLPEVKIGRAIPETASENKAAQLIVENYPNPPAIKHGGNEAYYKLSEDLVRMPKVEQFDSVNDYYRTLFHELTHSTRHENRLNREKISFRFGDSGYAKEELVAEFGAVFLSAWAGIMWYNNKNHAAYLKGWNSAIKEAENDNKFLMKAASLAQAATDYILNLNAAGQPAFLYKYEKPNKAEKPKKKASASKIQIIPPYPIDIESNEENDDYMQLEKELSNLMGDKFEVWANNLIEQKRKARLAERTKEIKANIAPLKKQEKGNIAYDNEYNKKGYKYTVRKKDTKKYEVDLTLQRYGRFNPNEEYFSTFKTPEECSAFIIKTIDKKKGFYYPNWYGLSELQNKINELKGYQYSKQFNYQEEEKKAEKTKPAAQKATEKADNTDKKYKFIAFYNSYGRINGIYSYQNLTINEFYLKNTFDDGIKVYAPLRSLEKIEEAKRIIEEQYIEGKDFICLKFESKKREEYYSLLIHSNEKPKPAAPKAKKNTKVGQYTGVKTIPLSDLYTDEKRFQNRKKLNEEIVENIVNNFKPTDLDPLVVWYDKKQGKTFVLAGHHRFEALKRLKHKNVPVKFANDDYPTEADAIRYAKEISNANRTLEEPYERAAIYRKYREEGYSEKEINDKAALEGKNRSYILNLSCLNPKGATMSTLVQFSQTQSKADKNEAERIADWIGQARRNAPELTDAHEKEMFDFLMNKEASKRTTTKVKFLEYVRACWNPFEPTAPLNLARMKYQSEGEKQY